MNDAIEGIAFKGERVLQPETRRHHGIGVMGTDRVEHQKEGNQRVGQIRQGPGAVEIAKQPDGHEYQEVFEEPVEAVHRSDRPDQPNNDKQRGQPLQQPVVPKGSQDAIGCGGHHWLRPYRSCRLNPMRPYSGSVSPEPPKASGMSLNFGRPSFIEIVFFT